MAKQTTKPQPLSLEPDLPLIHRLAEQYKLAVPRSPICGALGEMMGSSAGSSLEFQDFREYVPGDDPRHIDWSALGRSDQLMIRLYREEVSPFADILIDGSCSMAVGQGHKEKLTRELALAFDLFARRAGAQPNLWLVGHNLHKLEGSTQAKLDRLDFSSTSSFEHLSRTRATFLKRRSIRVVISDFLFVHQAELLVKHLAKGASALWLIQILTADEAQPALAGGVRLTDAENQQFQDIIMNEKNTSDYMKRLTNLQTDLARAARRAAARFTTVLAQNPLEQLCRENLLPSGIITAS